MARPAEATYVVGIITRPGINAKFLIQDFSLDLEMDEYSAKDEEGHTADLTHRDPRLTGTANFIYSVGEDAPLPGETVTVTGVKTPTWDNVNKKLTGSWAIDPQSTTPVKLLVTTPVPLNQNNTDYIQSTVNLVYYLANQFPAQDVNN